MISFSSGPLIKLSGGSWCDRMQLIGSRFKWFFSLSFKYATPNFSVVGVSYSFERFFQQNFLINQSKLQHSTGFSVNQDQFGCYALLIMPTIKSNGTFTFFVWMCVSVYVTFKLIPKHLNNTLKLDIHIGIDFNTVCSNIRF